MKYYLKLVTVLFLVAELFGFGIGTYWSVPKDLAFAPLVDRVDLDQQGGTYTIHYREDSTYWNKVYEMGLAGIPEMHNYVYHEIGLHPQPAQKKFKLVLHQKFFQKSKGFTPEALAAAIISIDRGRYHNNMVRMVGNIQRNCTAEQTINAINRIKHVNNRVLATMPVGQGPMQVTLHYFRLESGLFSPEQLAMEYERRGLIPDPQAQIVDNESDTSLANDYPNATQWILPNGSAHGLTFDESSVGCDGCTAWVGGDWWFAGIRRS